MIEFFRDVISGPVYIVAVILSVIFIMAIIGFLMERKKIEKEYNEQVAVVSNNQNVQPVSQVTIEKEVITNPTQVEELSDSKTGNIPIIDVSRPTIVFTDSEQEQK